MNPRTVRTLMRVLPFVVMALVVVFGLIVPVATESTPTLCGFTLFLAGCIVAIGAFAAARAGGHYNPAIYGRVFVDSQVQGLKLDESATRYRDLFAAEALAPDRDSADTAIELVWSAVPIGGYTDGLTTACCVTCCLKVTDLRSGKELHEVFTGSPPPQSVHRLLGDSEAHVAIGSAPAQAVEEYIRRLAWLPAR